MTALSGDADMASLFGVKTFRSHESVRRAFEHADEEAITQWIDQQVDRTYALLPELEWVLGSGWVQSDQAGSSFVCLSGDGAGGWQARAERGYPSGQKERERVCPADT